MKWLKKLLEQETPTESVHKRGVDVYHDYGLSLLEFGLRSGDYGQNIRGFKKVTLTNVSKCKNTISVLGLVTTWKGTGHVEWEYLLAGWFIISVIETLENQKEEADITCLFDRDLIASNGKVFTKEQIYDHLIDWFDIESETDDEIRVSLKFN